MPRICKKCGCYTVKFHDCEQELTEAEKRKALASLSCSARLVTWDNLQEIANWCAAADLYDTRVLLLISSPKGLQLAQVGDTVLKHENGTFSVQNADVTRGESATSP